MSTMEFQILHSIRGDNLRRFDTSTAEARVRIRQFIGELLYAGTALFLELPSGEGIQVRILGYDAESNRVLVKKEEAEAAGVEHELVPDDHDVLAPQQADVVLARKQREQKDAELREEDEASIPPCPHDEIDVTQHCTVCKSYVQLPRGAITVHDEHFPQQLKDRVGKLDERIEVKGEKCGRGYRRHRYRIAWVRHDTGTIVAIAPVSGGSEGQEAGVAERTLEHNFSWIAWREPQRLTTPLRSGLACRFCIAIDGFKANRDEHKLFDTAEQFYVHLAEVHGLPAEVAHG